MATVPWAGGVSTAQVLVSPATGVSLVPRLPETGVFSCAATLSGVATGVAGVTVSVTVAVDVLPAASVMVYVNESAPW